MDNIELRELVEKHKIIAILRGLSPEKALKTACTLYESGIRLLEVTFNQSSETKLKDTSKSISDIKAELGEGVRVGAGTVMSIEDLTVAYDSGAEFILSPNTNIEVIRTAVKKGVAPIPGAMTPSESAEAYENGAALVKLFPAGDLGLNYCRSIMSPLNHIPFIATGRIDETNLKDFLNAGFIGVGIGSSLTNKKMIDDGDFSGLKELADRYVKLL